MVEPRSLAVSPDNWLTDSRVYNLIWLGRWLERTESIARAVSAAAHRVRQAGGSEEQLAAGLMPIADFLGVALPDPAQVAGEILLNHPASSTLQCLSKARVNATQVAPVELIRVIGALILDLEETEADSLRSPEQVIAVTARIESGIADIYQAIESRWFSREALTEEEVFHRFVQ